MNWVFPHGSPLFLSFLTHPYTTDCIKPLDGKNVATLYSSLEIVFVFSAKFKSICIAFHLSHNVDTASQCIRRSLNHRMLEVERELQSSLSPKQDQLE